MTSLVFRACHPTQQRTHAGAQHRQREGLGEVVIGAQVEPAYDVLLSIASGEQQNRNFVPRLAQALQYLQTGDPGEHYVQQHEIDVGIVVALQPLERGLAALVDLNLIAFSLEIEAKSACEVVLVLNEQDEHFS